MINLASRALLPIVGPILLRLKLGYPRWEDTVIHQRRQVHGSVGQRARTCANNEICDSLAEAKLSEQRNCDSLASHLP
jgi:hypothetical protein